MKRSKKQQAAMMLRLQGKSQATSLGISELQAINARRRPGAIILDLLQRNKRTIPPGDAGVASWLKRPGRSDIIGVDTPGSHLELAVSKRTPTMRVSPLAGDLQYIRVPSRGARVQLSPELAKKREENLKALQGVLDSARAARERLEAALPEAEPKKRGELRAQLMDAKHRERNAGTQLDAYRRGDYLVAYHKKDAELAREHAGVLRRFFQANARNLSTNTLLVVRTQMPGVWGYTHAIHDAGYEGDLVAVQQNLAPKRLQRITQVHEQVHVMRKREAGRDDDLRFVEDYGRDMDKEEKETVLETEIRVAPVGEKRDEGYYSFIDAEDRRRGRRILPVRAGDADNALAQGKKKPTRTASLKGVAKGMKNAGRTHIARLARRGGKWGAVPPAAETVDRVLKVDGEAVHVRGSDQDADAIAAHLSGRKARVQEYQDGRLH